MAMRVTDSNLYRKYTTSVNAVHSQLNKSMNKISSGKAYESAAENPLAYYAGKRMDNQYQDVISKQELLKDVQNRLYQQELGVRSIQATLTSQSGDTVNTKINYILNTTNNEISTTVHTVRDDLIQKQQSMINDLNAQYENLYVYGGNDLSTVPFELSYDVTKDDMVFKYHHKFSGDSAETTFTFKMNPESGADGTYCFELDSVDRPAVSGTTGTDEELLQKAMSEQGRVDVGYGSIHNTDTLIDTYTGGLNFLTGMTSDVVKGMSAANFKDQFQEALTKSAIGLTGQAVITTNQYANYLDENRTVSTNHAVDKDTFSEILGNVITEIQSTSNKLGAIYSDLGNKYNQLENTADQLATEKISLETQYKDKLGADPYESIIEMFSHQRSYNAALQVSSRILGVSLFDFMS